MKHNRQARLLVVSAPSGGGKTTLCHKLLAELEGIQYSTSCTTRPPRAGETNGIDYFFMSEQDFMEKQKHGEFLESALVHGYWYGTPKEAVLRSLREGTDILMDIDVQGAEKIRNLVATDKDKELKNAFVDIFISPPDIETLRIRLVNRGKDNNDTIERRTNNAAAEMEKSDRYKYKIINDKLDTAYDCLRSIVIAERCRNPAGDE